MQEIMHSKNAQCNLMEPPKLSASPKRDSIADVSSASPSVKC